MEYSVSLKKIPDGLSFPLRLQERVSLDREKGRLTYRGFMTKCTYDELAKLSDDPEYRRALEQLFVLTSAEMSAAQPQRRGVWAAMAVAVVSTAAVLLLTLWVIRHHGSSGGSTKTQPQTTASTAAG